MLRPCKWQNQAGFVGKLQDHFRPLLLILVCSLSPSPGPFPRISSRNILVYSAMQFGVDELCHACIFLIIVLLLYTHNPPCFVGGGATSIPKSAVRREPNRDWGFPPTGLVRGRAAKQEELSLAGGFALWAAFQEEAARSGGFISLPASQALRRTLGHISSFNNVAQGQSAHGDMVCWQP